MNERNSYGKVGFIVVHLFYILTITAINSVLFERPLPGLSAKESFVTYLILTLALTAFGILLTYRSRRSEASVLANVMFPIGLYTMITYYRVFPILAQCIIVLVLVLATAYSSAVLTTKTSSYSGNEISVKKRLRHSFLGSRIIVSVGLAVFVTVVWWYLFVLLIG